MKKTGITEASIFIAVYGVVESAQAFFLENPIIPEPWGGLVIATTGVVLFYMRRKMKTAE